MVALKVSLPHISLSRTNSPSRPTTPSSSSSTLTTPGNDVAIATKSSSKPPSRSASIESTSDIVTAAEIAVNKLNLDSTAGPATSSSATTSKRAASLGALGAALRRNTTSNRVPSGNSVVASTPVYAKGLTPPSSRPASDSTAGLIPLRAQLASAAAGTSSTSSNSKGRSRSTDRRQLPIATAGLTPASSTTLQSHSQPPLSRNKAGAGGGKKSPVLSGAQSGHATPSSQHGPGARGASAALHNLEESYVGKVSLKLGEAVNKVFLAGGGPAAGEVVYKGRSAAKVGKTKDFGDMVAHELQAALHDSYLLRTLLRSSVLKSLSLYLTRLTALLLPADAVGPPPMCIKEADNLNPALRFNLEMVRCAYELKTALKRAGHGAPSFVQETLRPWVDKLAEVMNRVMNPLVFSIRVSVSLIAAKARIGENNPADAHSAGHHRDGTMSGSSSPLLGGPTSTTAVGAFKNSGSQLRSLSMGRSSTSSHGPANIGPSWLRELSAVLDATSRLVSRLQCGADGDKWLASVGTHAVWKGMLSLAARRLPEDTGPTNGGDGLISAATANHGGSSTPALARSSLFKGKRGESTGDTSPPLLPVSIGGVAQAGGSGAASAASGGAGSHYGSSTAGHHHTTCPSPADVALIRLLGELELLETKLNSYILSLSAVPNIDPDTLLSGKCADSLACGLCKTGRMFDPESDSDDEDDMEDIMQAGGLAQYAMREAMQALSALIVVVRASRRAQLLKDALLSDDARKPESQSVGKDSSSSTAVAIGPKQQQQQQQQQSDPVDSDSIVPLTPMAIINGAAVESRTSAPLSPPPTPPAPKEQQRQQLVGTTAAAAATSADLPTVCPTLVNALDTVPALILLHLLASRLPRSIFRLPHEIWNNLPPRRVGGGGDGGGGHSSGPAVSSTTTINLASDEERTAWRSYEKELRGFQAGEEWTAEVAWEMAGELARAVQQQQQQIVRSEDTKSTTFKGRMARLECLGVAIRVKAGVEVPESLH